MEPVQSVQVEFEKIHYTNWYKHNAPDSLLFKEKVTGKECKFINKDLAKLIPLIGIGDTVVFNPPSDPNYGCFSNWYPLKQKIPLNEKITPLKKTLEECGFKGTIACAAIGFTLLRVLIDGDNDKEKIHKAHLVKIFEVNTRLIQIMDAHKGHINTWEKAGKTEWNNQLRIVTAIKDALPYPFVPEKEKIVFDRFVEEILLVKFKSNPQIQETLLSIKGFFIDAAPGDNIYGIGLSLKQVIRELKAAETAGRCPFYEKDVSPWDGHNLQGLALEETRDRIISEPLSINWFKYHKDGTSTFTSTPNFEITPCKVGDSADKHFKSIPLNGIPDSIAYNTPRNQYGCFSNFYPQRQTLLLTKAVIPFKEILQKNGFNGHFACSAVGFAFLRTLEASDNKPEKVNIEFLKTIIETNKALIEIMNREGDDINSWEGLSNNVKKKVLQCPTFNDWNSKLIALMQGANKIVLTQQKEIIFYRNFIDGVLYPKFKENEKIREVLLSVKGFIFEAARGNRIYGTGKDIKDTVAEVKLAENEGRLPELGNNLQGLALEEVRDRIEKELKLKQIAV